MENDNLKNNQPDNKMAEQKTNTNSIYYYKVSYNKPQDFEIKKQPDITPQISIVGKNTPIQQLKPVFKPQPIVTKSGSTVQVQFNKPALSEVEKALLERVGKQPVEQNLTQQKQVGVDGWQNRSKQTLKVQFNKPFQVSKPVSNQSVIEPVLESIEQIQIETQPTEQQPIEVIQQPVQPQPVEQVAEPVQKPVQTQSINKIQQPVSKTFTKFSQIVYTPSAVSNKPGWKCLNNISQQNIETTKPAVETKQAQVVEVQTEQIVEPKTTEKIESAIVKEPVQAVAETISVAEPVEIAKESSVVVSEPTAVLKVEKIKTQSKQNKKAKEIASIVFYVGLLLFCFYCTIFNVTTIFKVVMNKNYIPTFFGYKPIVNYSSSEAYNLQEYDLLLFEKATNQNIKVDDMVLFFKEDNLTIQKVKDVYVSGGVTQIITETEDEKTGYQLTLADLEGRYVKKRKGVGKFMAFMKTDAGITLSMIVPIVAYTSIELLIYLRARKKKIAHTSWPKWSNYFWYVPHLFWQNRVPKQSWVAYIATKSGKTIHEGKGGWTFVEQKMFTQKITKGEK